MEDEEGCCCCKDNEEGNWGNVKKEIFKIENNNIVWTDWKKAGGRTKRIGDREDWDDELLLFDVDSVILDTCWERYWI